MAENKSDRNTIFAEGKNCWRIAPADRAAFLIDGASYFAAFVSAVKRAKRSVLIVGWDFDSRIQLKHGDEPHGARPTSILLSFKILGHILAAGNSTSLAKI
jgi:hypothetical protein